VLTLGPSFSASRRPGHRMSLSTLVSYRRRSAAADSGMPATPDSFRLSQNPLGAYHLPQALTFVAPSPLREGSFVSSGGVALSSVLTDSRAIPFFLTASWSCNVSHAALLRVANALATWRQAKVSLRPLLITAKQSLPAASTPAPGPHTSRSYRCYAVSAQRRLDPDKSGGLFRHRLSDSSGASASLAVPVTPRGTWTYV